MAFVEIQASDFDKAVQFSQQALAADPGNLSAEQTLASALERKGEYAQAVEPLTRIAHAGPTVENLYGLAACLLQTGKPEDKPRAVAVFGQMERTAGDSGSLHVLFGRAYRDGGDTQSAVREFKRLARPVSLSGLECLLPGSDGYRREYVAQGRSANRQR